MIKTYNYYLLSTKQIFWILLSVVISVAPHLPRLPIWFGFFTIAVVISRWLTASKNIKPIPKLLIAFITIMLVLAIIYFQGFKLNREISVTILSTMTVLKLLETWQKRDAWMVVTLCYFVILTRFFYSQDLLLIIYLLASVFVITHTLFVIQHDDDTNVIEKKEIKQTFGLLMTGLPLAALFFLFFPRLGAPIWGSPDFFGQGKTGMSEEMSPGSISNLFNDDSTAFRVTFDDEQPPNSLLYWRGPVLWDFDGKTWTKNKSETTSKRQVSFIEDGPKVSYEIELEPTGQHHLFALDYLIEAPKGARLLTDSQLLYKNKINQLGHYKVTSVLKTFNPYERLSLQALEQLKALPEGFNPKTVSLMRQWQSLNLSAEELIKKALLMFRNKQYYYSYTPPLLFGNTVDQFLFETRSGFCEHYASAFTIMMRAAGIPARIVTGYQGGIKNEDYLLIKQSDAHAWSEVWIKDKGWLRVDPTSAVSPERVEKGSQALMRENSRSWHDSNWYRKMGERYDGVRHNWNKWVRDYNAVKQKALFEVFGFDSQNGKSIALVLGIIIISTTLIVLLFLYITRPKRILTHYDKIYQQFLSVFIKQGLNKDNGIGVTAFSETACKQFPQIQMPINEFTQLYLKLRFSGYNKVSTNLDKKLLKLILIIKTKIKLKGINHE